MEIKPKRAVVLLSGGLDSATVLAVAKREGYELFALTFSYGQRHAWELEAANASPLQSEFPSIAPSHLTCAPLAAQR